MQRQRTLFIWFVVLAFFVTSTHAEAAIDDQLNQMFGRWGLRSASSPPTAFQGQTRNAYTGGSLEMRFENDPVALATIAPPRLSVGCGGIDVYLGSFSYGSLNRYVQLLQQIGTGVVLGYAFQLAMKAICPDCADVLNKLEAAARALNTAGRIGPCNAAQNVKAALAAGNSLKELGSTVSKATDSVLESRGRIADMWENRDVRAGEDIPTALASMAAEGVTANGNLVWRALGQAVPAVPTDVRRFIMSITGTVVVDAQGIPSYFPPTLSHADILHSSTTLTITPTSLFRCLDNEVDCLQMDQVEENFTGFKELIGNLMVGIATAIETGRVLNAAEQNLVNSVPVPIYSLYARRGHTREDRQAITAQYRDVIGANFAFYYMRYLSHQLTRQVLSFKLSNPEFIGDVQQYLDNLQRVMDEAYKDLSTENEKVMSTLTVLNTSNQGPRKTRVRR